MVQLWMLQGSQEVNSPCSIFPHSYHPEVPSRWDMGHLASLVGWVDCKLQTPTCQVSHWCLCEAPAKQARPAGLEGCQGCSSWADFVADRRPSERKALQASLSSAQKCWRQFQTLTLVLGTVLSFLAPESPKKKTQPEKIMERSNIPTASKTNFFWGCQIFFQNNMFFSIRHLIPGKYG